MDNLFREVEEAAINNYGMSEKEALTFAEQFAEDIRECMWMEFDYRLSEYMEEYRRSKDD